MIGFIQPALLLLTAISLAAETHHAGELILEPYSFRPYDGSAHAGELGHLWVRENRRPGSGRLIEIAFVRLRTTAQKPRSPLVFLPGGPGIPGAVLGRVPVYFQLLEKIRAFSDVILADQRGIGMSSPNTDCPEGMPPAPDVFEKESSFLDLLAARMHACADSWRSRGVDLAAYTTAESADDLEDLRQAIGADKLSLLAHSYGTALALAAMRRHGEHLDRVVLAGVEGPDENLQLPLAFDFALRRVSEMAAKSPKLEGAFPDTYGELHQVLTRLEREPLPVRIRNERTKQEVDVKLGPFPVQFAIKGMLPNGRQVGRVPALVYSLAHRDPALLAGAVQDLYSGLMSGFSAMQFAVACSDGWSSARRELAREEAARSLFGDVPFAHLDPRICEGVGAGPAPADSLLPVWRSVPTLLVNGTLDGNTPTYQAEEVGWGLANAEFVTVENGFHETLPAEEVQALVAQFLGGAQIGRRMVHLPAPDFLTIEEAKTAQQTAH